MPGALQLCPTAQAAGLPALLLCRLPEAPAVCAGQHLVCPLPSVPQGHCRPRGPHLQPARPGGCGGAASPAEPRDAVLSSGAGESCHLDSRAPQFDRRGWAGRGECQPHGSTAPGGSPAPTVLAHRPHHALHLPRRHAVGAHLHHRPGPADVQPLLLSPQQPGQLLALPQDSLLQPAETQRDLFHCLTRHPQHLLPLQPRHSHSGQGKGLRSKTGSRSKRNANQKCHS